MEPLRRSGVRSRSVFWAELMRYGPARTWSGWSSRSGLGWNLSPQNGGVGSMRWWTISSLALRKSWWMVVGTLTTCKVLHANTVSSWCNLIPMHVTTIWMYLHAPRCSILVTLTHKLDSHSILCSYALVVVCFRRGARTSGSCACHLIWLYPFYTCTASCFLHICVK